MSHTHTQLYVLLSANAGDVLFTAETSNVIIEAMMVSEHTVGS